VGVAARLLDEAGIARTVVLQPGRLPRVEDVAALLRERRPDKVPDDARAAELASNPIVCAVGLLALGDADAAVAGATCPTAEVVRSALWLVGAAPGIETVSSAFYMYLPPPPPLPSPLPGERKEEGAGRGEQGRGHGVRLGCLPLPTPGSCRIRRRLSSPK
jgi:phosphotransacetylase